MKNFYIGSSKLATLGPTVYYMLVSRCEDAAAETFRLMQQYRYVHFDLELGEVNHIDESEDLVGIEEVTTYQILEYLDLEDVSGGIFFGIGQHIEITTIRELGEENYNLFRQMLKQKYGYNLNCDFGSFKNLPQYSCKYALILDSDLDLVFHGGTPNDSVSVSLEEILEFIEENRVHNETNVLHNQTTIQEINETIKILEKNVRDAQIELERYLKSVKNSLQSIEWPE